MNIQRRITRSVRVGRLQIGGEAPIAVQSLTNTDTHDRTACLAQARALEAAGCDVIRLTVPDRECAGIFPYLREQGITAALVADVHFDYRIAVACAEAGTDKIRINPGNIGGRDRVEAVVRACRSAGIPIRIGVNGGSLEKHILARYGAATGEALAESALYHAELLEACDFHDIILSVKSSSVPQMLEANRILAARTSYPLHLGVTEAGGVGMGTVKSAVGIGTLLAEGIGDTVRVSLTADPVREVAAARDILDTLGLNTLRRMNIVSCPTCGRTRIDLIGLLADFERAVDEAGLRQKPITVALMGCAVNGPGEARAADIGIAGGDGCALLFRRGEILRKLPSDRIIDALLEEIRQM